MLIAATESDGTSRTPTARGRKQGALLLTPAADSVAVLSMPPPSHLRQRISRRRCSRDQAVFEGVVWRRERPLADVPAIGLLQSRHEIGGLELEHPLRFVDHH